MNDDKGPGDKGKKKKKAYVFAEAPTKDGKREEAFITEAGNVKTYYAKKDPNVEVEVIPFYGQEEFDAAKDRIGQMGEEDEVFLFGHSGNTLGGIDHEYIAKSLKEAGNKSCNIGSCGFESHIGPYKDIQNVTYRGKDAWQGFNPKGDSLMSAMYSRANDWDKGVVGIVDPEEGVHYNKIFNRPKESLMSSVPRMMPATDLAAIR